MRIVPCVLLLLSVAILPLARAADSTSPTMPATTRVAVEFDPADVPTTAGYHVVRLKLRIDDKPVQFPCGIYLPADFFKADAKLPVVIGLHNKVAIGTDQMHTLSDEALGYAMVHDTYDGRASGKRPANPTWPSKGAPFVALMPECPAGYLWESPVMAPVIGQLVERAIDRCHGDRDRIYLTGFSYGGSSTWVIASELPDTFAAIAPIDGRATTRPADTAAKLKRTAVYLVVGGADKDFLPEAQRMRDALSALPHPNFVSRILPGGNHFCYSMIYTDPLFWDWMLAQRRVPADKVSPHLVPKKAAP
jgi:hypothetical protein